MSAFQEDGSGSEEEEDVMARAAKLNEYGFDEGELGFSGRDLEAAMRVVKSLGGNIVAFKSRPFKDIRGALHPLIEEQLKNYDVKGGGGSVKRRRGRDRDAEVEEAPSLKDLDKQWRNQTALRAKRLATLEALNAATGPLLGPGGVPLTITHKGEVDEAVEQMREQQLITANAAGQGSSGGGSAVARVPDGVAELNKEEEEAFSAGQRPKLNIAAKCYICKKPYVDLHFFYDQLCPGCAELNYRKRNETVDMLDKVAIVTGARVKIGYRCALKLYPILTNLDHWIQVRAQAAQVRLHGGGHVSFRNRLRAEVREGG